MNQKDNNILGLPAETQFPPRLNVLPIAGRPIFPGIFTPLMLSASEDIKVIEEAMSGDGFLGLVLTKEDKDKVTAEDLYSVGTVARIIRKINLPDGGVNVFVSTLQRFKIRKILNAVNPIAVAAEYLEDEEDDSFEVKALTRALISEMKEISENNPMFSEEMRLNMVNIDHAGKIADFITSILNIAKEEQQKVLEILNVRRRMEQVLVYIKKEQQIYRMQKKVQNEINERVEKNQREYFLREELKNIQEELGISQGGQQSDYQKFKDKIDSFHFEGEVKEALDGELEKFRLLDPHDPDYNMSRNYLDTVTSLPWNDDPLEDYSIEEAKKVLEADHYGLEDVKRRIIEHLSVRLLKNDGRGGVLILVGPPGVGKTSVGRSIARAMHKKFFRFSVGGEHDESKIKGFRRTYIGSMPGQIIEGLKITKSKAPVFMIDEVDKMNASAQGDPAAALLEVLDPEQNYSFRDNYINLPFDLSRVFFILTANTLDTIPRPLLDRAEVIEISGYVDQEKIQIAKRYLVPKNLVKNGFKKTQVYYTSKALALIATEYAREAGVRNFEKCIDKINRKLVTEEVETLEKAAYEAPKEVPQVEPAAPASAVPDAAPQVVAEAAPAGAEAAPEAGAPEAAAQASEGAAQAAEAAPQSSEAAATLEGAEAAASVIPDGAQRQSGISSAKDSPSAAAGKGATAQGATPQSDARKRVAEAVAKKRYKIDVPEVRKYLGKAVFDESELKRAAVPGTAIGLAWTSMGGDTLLLEAIAFQSNNAALQLTGQMGDVMKESAQIAMNWSKQYALEKKIKDVKWFEKNTVHLHIPEGATPKDGPSAGITMATTFVSLFKGKRIKPHLAMTGELSLTGQVLPIGGLREKTVAAKRNKIRTILIPKANERDLEEIPEQVKSGIKFIPVSNVREVMDLVF